MVFNEEETCSTLQLLVEWSPFKMFARNMEQGNKRGIQFAIHEDAATAIITLQRGLLCRLQPGQALVWHGLIEANHGH